jgi:SAM-dependent methyltransferase
MEQLREVDDPADFYAPMARRFGQDPQRTDDPSLEILRELAAPGETWLDIGAGGGRYALPLALIVRRVYAVDPSPSMLAVLQEGMAVHGIENIDVAAGDWPMNGSAPEVDVALMAHIGYDIERFGAFLDAAEAAATKRCVVIMRTGLGTTAGSQLWEVVHGEPRVPYPMLPELLTLLVARGVAPEITLADRGTWGYDSTDQLVEASRRQLWVRPGSDKDRHLVEVIRERATERDGQWSVDWRPMRDGVVTWTPHRQPA